MIECPSILLLLPYFGALPTYADLFFRSCAENPTVNWLLITDQEVDGRRLPANVAVKRTTFKAMKQSIDDCMGMETALLTPYKLCDFKPAYGVIFANEVSGYDFWGHCDMDVLFGDIRTFLTKDVLGAYKKVLIHGHLSLYRNCDEANHYFELRAPGVSFRDVFAVSKSRAFDEFGGVRILLDHHRIPFFRDDRWLADIDPNVYRLRTIHPPNYQHQCFYWERGRVFKEFWDGETRGKLEYMYIHLQKRPMVLRADDLSRGHDAWYITPRAFTSKRSDPGSPAEMDQLNPGSMLFDSRRWVVSSFWCVQNSLSQAVRSVAASRTMSGHRAAGLDKEQ